MRRASALLVALALVVAGCGGDEEGERAIAPQPAGDPTAAPEPDPRQDSTSADSDSRASTGGDAAGRPAGTTITLRESPFGKMLFDARRQAIYVFENDRRNRTVCYGDCAEAWPPVHANGEPRAGPGVRAELLGTIRRRDGRRQVTYAGRPLYHYAHEKPGEVRCHNVDLHGGLWWVIGADGKRRP